MLRPPHSRTVVSLVIALGAISQEAIASEVAVPLSTPRIDGLDIELSIGQELVKLASKLGYDAAGRVTGEAAIDGADATALGKLSRRGASFFLSIVFTGVTEQVTMKVEGTVGSGAALVSYSGPKGKVQRVPTPVSLAATLGALPGTFDVVGEEDVRGKITAAGRFTSGLGNDPAGEGTLQGKLKRGTTLSFRFKNERQKVSFRGVRQGDFFVGTLKLSSPPARETLTGFLLPAGFLLRFNPTVFVTSFTSDRERAQIGAGARLDWSLRGVPTSVLLEPGSRDVTSVLTTDVVPFAAAPAAVDPRAVFKVTARDLVTTAEVSQLAEALQLGGPGTGGVDRDAAASIAALADGGVLVLGTFSGTVTFGAGGPNARTLTAEGGTDIYLASLAGDRTLRFVAQIHSAGGGDEPRAVTALPDGGFVITGALDGARSFPDAGAAPAPPQPGAAGLDLFVAGYTATGRVLFALAPPLPGDESGTAVAAYLDGGFLVAGFAGDPNDGNQIAAAKVLAGARGAELASAFNVAAGGPGDDRALSVATFPDGTAVLVGFFEQAATFGGAALVSRGGRDAFVARIDGRGDFTSVQQIGGRGDDAALAVAALADGSAVVTGSFRGEVQVSGATSDVAFTAAGGEDDEDAFIVRYNAKGEIEFATRAGGPSNDAGLGVAALGDGSSIVCGAFSTTARFGSGTESVELVSAGDTDAFLARFDARGRLQHAVGLGGAGEDEGRAVAALADGTVLFAGDFSGAAIFGFGEAGETSLTAEGAQDAFLVRHDPANFRLVEVRPEGLAYAKVPGAGPNPNHLGSAVAASSDGSCWVAGTFDGELLLRDDPDPSRRIALAASGTLDAFLAHVLPDGTVDRAIQIGDPLGSVLGQGVAALLDGGAVVTGSFKGPATFAPGVTLTPAGSSDMFLARYRADGSLVFAVRGGGTGVDLGNSVAVLAEDEEILVTGRVDSASALQFPGALNTIAEAARNRAADIFVARYTSAGDPSVVLLAGGPGDDEGTGIAGGAEESLWVTGRVDTGAGSIAIGESNGTIVVLSPPAAGAQGILVHYDDDDEFLAARLFGGPGRDAGAAVAALADGGVLVTGSFVGTAVFGGPPAANATLTAAGGTDAFVARFSADASLVHVKRAGGLLNDEGRGIAALPDGSAVVTGSFSLDAEFGEGAELVTLTVTENPRLLDHSDVFLACYDPSGALRFARGAGGGGPDGGLGIAALPDGSAVLTGAIGSGTVALRRGPPIVFGAGEANETSFADLEMSGIVVVAVRSLFLAKYFPYGAGE